MLRTAKQPQAPKQLVSALHVKHVYTRFAFHNRHGDFAIAKKNISKKDTSKFVDMATHYPYLHISNISRFFERYPPPKPNKL
jgi:hypothetical protein